MDNMTPTPAMTENKQRWATLAAICREVGGTVAPFEGNAVAGPWRRFENSPARMEWIYAGSGSGFGK